MGDDDQSIYQWRGATVENILTFTNVTNVSTCELPQNRRSQPAIIEVTEALRARDRIRTARKSIKARATR